MFTGIIRYLGFIVFKNDSHLQVQIKNVDQSKIKLGDSIAINGICLTVVDIQNDVFSFDVMTETSRVTTFSEWKEQQVVNIELAFQPGVDRLDGHIVSGHVNSRATLKQRDENNKFIFELQNTTSNIKKHLIPKGSITIDGVSLTVVDVTHTGFSVCIIPYTLEHTIFHTYQPNVLVNIELSTDIYQTTLAINDEDGIQEAIKESHKGKHTAPPNPWVGCVIVDKDKRTILARGFHEKPGTPHAEVHAFSQLKLDELNDETKLVVYVTLEPCCHTGRTGPCTDILIKYKKYIDKVVVGMTDPDPRVQGKGCEALQKEGINVDLLNHHDIKIDLRSYIKHRRFGVPWVIFKIASTFDGKVACPGHRLFTSTSAIDDVHETRFNVQAIITSTKTVEADCPRLSVRRYKSYHNEEARPIYVVGKRNVKFWYRFMENTSVFEFDDVQEALKHASSQGYLSCLVEAGPTLFDKMMSENLIDEVHFYLDNKVTRQENIKGWNIQRMLEDVYSVQTFDSTVKIVYFSYPRDFGSRFFNPV